MPDDELEAVSPKPEFGAVGVGPAPTQGAATRDARVQGSAPLEVPHARVRSDCRLMRRLVHRLGLPFVLRRLALVVLTVIVFWFVAQAILNYGAGVSYSRLGPPDAAIVSLLDRINPYLWWTLVVILGLIVFFWLRSSWYEGVLRERAVPVPSDDVRTLAAQLSPPVLDVVRWVWSDHNYPLTQGDLRRAIAEVRAGRIQKMRLAIEQQSILGARRPI